MVRLFSVSKATAYALAIAQLANAQTFTDCNPLKSTNCPIRPGFPASYSVDFKNGADGQWHDMSHPTTFGSEGAVFSIQAAGDSVTYASNNYLFFGRVEAKVKVAPGQGIVSSFVLQSDDLDEIDWEWIGSKTEEGQSNYFGKGDTTTYDRGATHAVSAVTTTYHTYAVDWTKDSLQWIIDGKTVRTLKYADASKGTRYPQTPMQIRLGNWIAGSKNNSQGTIDWAGGLADMSKAPFNMYVESITVKSYAPAAAYQYGDKSGSYQSIKLLSSYKPSASASASAALPSASGGSKGVSSASGSRPSSAAGSKASSAAGAKPSSSGKTSVDGSCGGTLGYTCIGAPSGNCCSEYGYCGSTDEYCGTGCNSAFGTCGSGSGTTTPGTGQEGGEDEQGDSKGDEEGEKPGSGGSGNSPSWSGKPVYSGSSFPMNDQQKKVVDGFIAKLCASPFAKSLPSCKSH